MNNEFQITALYRTTHAEAIAEAELSRLTPRRPGPARRWTARAMRRLADRISPEPAGTRPGPAHRRPTTV
ncbi:hypothetical protein ACWDTT_07935 [Streptosporangium sandarakinum]|uniref:hypothetical protein n=1 Tax=Streptosporangium sandarakinum TaxID=1260955 RepID=UPI003789B084